MGLMFANSLVVNKYLPKLEWDEDNDSANTEEEEAHAQDQSYAYLHEYMPKSATVSIKPLANDICQVVVPIPNKWIFSHPSIHPRCIQVTKSVVIPTKW